jgi:hypothetical protein
MFLENKISRGLTTVGASYLPVSIQYNTNVIGSIEKISSEYQSHEIPALSATQLCL